MKSGGDWAKIFKQKLVQTIPDKIFRRKYGNPVNLDRFKKH